LLTLGLAGEPDMGEAADFGMGNSLEVKKSSPPGEGLGCSKTGQTC
jgi:hypothetical protein